MILPYFPEKPHEIENISRHGGDGDVSIRVTSCNCVASMDRNTAEMTHNHSIWYRLTSGKHTETWGKKPETLNEFVDFALSAMYQNWALINKNFILSYISSELSMFICFCVFFLLEIADIRKQFPQIYRRFTVCLYFFQAGESINLVGWRKIDFSEAMYAAHLYILKLVAMKHDAAFWTRNLMTRRLNNETRRSVRTRN